MSFLTWLLGAEPHETFPDYTGEDEQPSDTKDVSDLVQSIHDNVEKAPGDISDSEAETDADADGEGGDDADGGDSDGGDGR